MEVLYEQCCGLDIHKKLVVARMITPGPKGAPHKEVRSFGTMSPDLLELGDWLKEQGATHVAMESTGVYWKPLFNLLEERLTLVLANAQHIKQVPVGRPMSRTASGSLTCFDMGCCVQASCRIDRNASCAS